MKEKFQKIPLSSEKIPKEISKKYLKISLFLFQCYYQEKYGNFLNAATYHFFSTKCASLLSKLEQQNKL